jgi:hypothetical protein
MGPPSFMRSVVDRNVVMRRKPVLETCLPWIAQLEQRLSTGRTVRGSNPGEGEFSRAVQIGPESHAASCPTSTESFPGVKRTKRGVDHPPPSSVGLLTVPNHISAYRLC